jgi:type IV pilus assembly protein PilB
MNEDALRDCAALSGLPARAMIAAPTDILKAIRLYYGATPGASVPATATAKTPAEGVPLPTAPPAIADGTNASPASDGTNASQASVTSPSPVSETNATPVSEAIPPPPSEAIPAPASEAIPLPAMGLDSEAAAAATVVAPFAVDEPASSKRKALPSDAPVLEVREIELPRNRRRNQLQLTLLDGTTIRLPTGQKKGRVDPAARAESSSEQDLTSKDLLAALRAAAHGADAAEILGDNLRWEKMMAALLSLLLRKHLILERELIEELKKI